MDSGGHRDGLGYRDGAAGDKEAAALAGHEAQLITGEDVGVAPVVWHIGEPGPGKGPGGAQGGSGGGEGEAQDQGPGGQGAKQGSH